MPHAIKGIPARVGPHARLIGPVLLTAYTVLVSWFVKSLAWQMLGLLLVLGVICTITLTQKGPSALLARPRTALEWLLIGYAGLILVGLLYALLRGNDPALAVGQALTQLLPLAVYLLLRPSGSGALSAVYAVILVFLTAHALVELAIYLPRNVSGVHSDFRFANRDSVWAGLGFLLAAALLLSGKRSRLEASLLIGAAVVSSLLLLLTYTRSFWVGSAAGLAAALLAAVRSKRTQHALLLLVSIAVAVGLVAALSSALHSRGSPSVVATAVTRISSIPHDESAATRVNEYQAAIPVIKENPIFGIGLGGRYRVYWYTATFTGWTYVNYVHNFFIFLALKLGIIGLIVYSLLAAVIVRTAWLSATRGSAAGAVGGFVCLAVYVSLLITSVTAAHLADFLTTPFVGLVLAGISSRGGQPVSA